MNFDEYNRVMQKKESVEMQQNRICRGKRYRIKEGDTLYAISRREKIPLEWILRANPYVNVYNLQVGEWICIPGWEHREDGDNYDDDANEMPELVLVDYVIGEEETLEDVLKKFHMDLEDLLKYNGLRAITLKKGSILKIPRKVDE